MKVPIRLSRVVLVLTLFQTLVTAFPPALQLRTTHRPPATRIITSLTPTTDATAAPTRTDAATDISISPSNSQPPNTAIPIPSPASVPAPAPIPNAYLELRQYLSSTPVSGPVTGTDTATTTPFAFPSGVNDLGEWQLKYHQSTFWSCVTDDAQTHCGWHEPVLPGGTDIAGAPPMPRGRGRGWLVFGVGVGVGVVAWLF